MSASPTTPSSIISLNAQAVELISHELYRPALSKLKEALRQLRISIMPSANRSSESHNPKLICPSSTLQVRSHRIQAGSVGDGDGDGDDHKFNFTSSTPAFVLYDRLLLLSGYEEDVYATAKSEERASGVLIYNMALLHHIVGLKGGPGHSDKLLKAIRLYEMVASTVSVTEALQSSSDCLLYLATLNNKGMIHSFFCETDKTQDCTQNLHFVLSTMSHGELSEDDVFHFQFNVFLLLTQHGHAPAA